MSHKIILKKIVVTTVLFILFAIIFLGLTTTFDTIINNHLALGQLENDDASWIFMELYNNVGRPVMNILAIIISLSYILHLVTNIIKYFKLKETKQ